MRIGQEQDVDETLLEYLCDELTGQDKWYWYPPSEIYLRLDKSEKTITSACYGRFLPVNAIDVLKSRVTIKLINHWRKNGSTNNNV